MNELQIFNSEEFGDIRTVTIENEPMFCLSDVCKALGLTQPSKVKDRLNEKGVNTIPTLTAGGEQKLLYINESNLYKTIFQIIACMDRMRVVWNFFAILDKYTS